MYLAVLVVIAVLLGLLGFMTAPDLEGRRKVSPFIGVRWAHRGLHDIDRGIPENSMAAFQAAKQEGFGIELDVHLTKDKQLVVFHDDMFERVCGEPGRVEDTEYAKMARYRLCGTEERIPLLSEVLRAVDGKVPLLIEVKLPNADTEICRYLIRELENYNGRYMIQSFNCLVLRWLKKYRGEIPRGQLSSNLTEHEKNPHYLLRFCVKYLLSNWICRPDFISYKWADRRNPGFWLNRVIFRAPTAAWTLHGSRAVTEAGKKADMLIFEQN